jgi:hypothetical protein
MALPRRYPKKPSAPRRGAGCLASGRCYPRRRMAYVKTPEPSNSAAAGRTMAEPPVPGSCPPPSTMVVPPIMVVSCAIATGARTTMSRRAAVARNIALFIQSSFLRPACFYKRAWLQEQHRARFARIRRILHSWGSAGAVLPGCSYANLPRFSSSTFCTYSAKQLACEEAAREGELRWGWPLRIVPTREPHRVAA